MPCIVIEGGRERERGKKGDREKEEEEKEEEERFYLYTAAPDLPQGYIRLPFISI